MVRLKVGLDEKTDEGMDEQYLLCLTGDKIVCVDAYYVPVNNFQSCWDIFSFCLWFNVPVNSYQYSTLCRVNMTYNLKNQ